MKPALLLVLGVAAIAGCDGSDTPRTTSPTPAPAATNFTTFVKSQVAATSETSTPVDISGVTFSFTDETNETAFNDVLPP